MTRTFRGGIALAILLWIPWRVQAQEVLDLSDVLERVRSDQPGLVAARTEAAAIRTGVAYADALPDPMVGLTVQPFPVYTARGTQRSIWRAEQRLPARGLRSAQRGAALADASAAEWRALSLEADAILAATKAFYELAGAQARGELIEQFRRELANFEEVAAIQYETGAGPQQAVLKAQIEKNKLLRTALSLEAEAHEAQGELNVWTGGAVPDSSVAQLPEFVPAGRDGSIEHATRPRHLAGEEEFWVRVLESRSEAAGFRARMSESALLPDFSGQVTLFDIAKSSRPTGADGRNALGIGISMRVPLGRSDKRAAIEENRLRERAMQEMATDRRLKIDSTVEALWKALEDQGRAVRLIRSTLIPQAETAVQATLSAYTNGRTDFLDLLDAQRTLFTLRLDLVTTQVTALQHGAELERLLGRPLSMNPIDG